MIATDSVVPAQSAPRPLAWVALGASAVAVAAVGVATTVAVLTAAGPRLERVPSAFWFAAAGGAAATCASLALRTLRWIFLLRRAGARVPLRDACIGYLSGLSLLFVPLLAGEIAVRAYVQRSRAGVPMAATTALVLWERLLDVTALAFIAAVSLGLMGSPQAAVLPLTLVVATSTRSFRQRLRAAVVLLAGRAVRWLEPEERGLARPNLAGISEDAAWLTALTASIVLWTLPALALWACAASWTGVYGFLDAQFAYAASALSGGLMLAPGGVRVVGASLIASLTATGLPEPDAAVTVLAVRLVTAGLASVLGALFVWVHLRTRPRARDSHFDDIAHAYDAQIPSPQREALLTRKTALMAAALSTWRTAGESGADPVASRLRGLDVGCGQGWYVARMRQLGFDVHGIDASAGQVARARRHVDDPALIAEGSARHIAAPDASYDFVYTINVLHHLASAAEQREAFAELLRVLRPGGLLFVHEINTRNLLFRFYMGYVFPSLNCIDEGTERWLRPDGLARYTRAPVLTTEYFTFMPEFVPGWILRLLRPIESRLERSRLRVFSAHYMAVLQKPVTAS